MQRLLRPRKGVPVSGHKELTAGKPIVEGPIPSELVFPMMMHSGVPAEVCVKVGDQVRIGTQVGRAPQHISANIHSSVSGTVKAIEQRDSFRGPTLSVVIENNGLDDKQWLEPLDESISAEKFFGRLRDAGITGKGGAGFPAHVKLSPRNQRHRYVLINGAECEPFSTTDHRTMLEYAPEILHTVELLRRLFNTEHNVIAIEDDKPDAIARLQEVAGDLGYKHIRIRKVHGRYPQGDQGVLLRSVFGLEIPQGKFPNEMGILTSNVSTVKAVHDAVFMGRPLVRRVITVTGPVIANPQNVLTRVGTPVRELVDFCGGFTGDVGKMINGGPMMGRPFSAPEIPVVKDTTTILCFGAEARVRPEERACIRCAKCIDVCPVNLQPILISNARRAGRLDLCKVLKAESCIYCGCCTYICPSRIPLLKDIMAGLEQLRQSEAPRSKPQNSSIQL